MVDASLYGSVLRILEWTLAAYDRLGTVRHREGNRLANSAPLDNYPTADGRYVCIVAGSDANFARLCRAMDRPDLAATPASPPWPNGRPGATRSTAIVADWTAARRPRRSKRRCVAHDVPVATAYTAARHRRRPPHGRPRRPGRRWTTPSSGPIRQQAPFPRYAGHRPPSAAGAPGAGPAQ